MRQEIERLQIFPQVIFGNFVELISLLRASYSEENVLQLPFKTKAKIKIIPGRISEADDCNLVE